ncbi:MAG: dethiobiotin synthase [Firmicutes bacterium]|nr:dethiobiotin synthase [Bacillota bacterium]
MTKGIFLTGTGTDIGKTYVAGLITKKLEEAGFAAAYYKAAMSGNARRGDGTLIPGDADHVKRVSGIRQPLEEMCPYVYEQAYSPHLAARLEGNPVDAAAVAAGWEALLDRYDFITAEGSGGILCPIRFQREHGEHRILLEDIIRMLRLPSLIVADAGLGTINSVVLTAEYMLRRDLPVRGIIFNHWHPGDVMEEDNRYMCEELTGIPVVACVKPGDTDLDIGVDALSALYEPIGRNK